MQKSRPSGVCRRESRGKYWCSRERRDAQSIIDECEPEKEEGQQSEEKPEQKEADKYRGRSRKHKEQQKNAQKQAAQLPEKPKTAEDMINILLGRKTDKKKEKDKADKKKKKKSDYRQSPLHKEMCSRIRGWKDARRVNVEYDTVEEDDAKKIGAQDPKKSEPEDDGEDKA